VSCTARDAIAPRIASVSKFSATKSATAIGSTRVASRPTFAPNRRKFCPSRIPVIASASEGLLRSGGVATWRYARKLAMERTW
jgi:hypothetical protein